MYSIFYLYIKVLFNSIGLRLTCLIGLVLVQNTPLWPLWPLSSLDVVSLLAMIPTLLALLLLFVRSRQKSASSAIQNAKLKHSASRLQKRVKIHRKQLIHELCSLGSCYIQLSLEKDNSQEERQKHLQTARDCYQEANQALTFFAKSPSDYTIHPEIWIGLGDFHFFSAIYEEEATYKQADLEDAHRFYSQGFALLKNGDERKKYSENQLREIDKLLHNS